MDNATQLGHAVQHVYADAGRALSSDAQATWDQALSRMSDGHVNFLLDVLNRHLCPGGGHGVGLPAREMLPVLEEVLVCA